MNNIDKKHWSYVLLALFCLITCSPATKNVTLNDSEGAWWWAKDELWIIAVGEFQFGVLLPGPGDPSAHPPAPAFYPRGHGTPAQKWTTPRYSAESSSSHHPACKNRPTCQSLSNIVHTVSMERVKPHVHVTDMCYMCYTCTRVHVHMLQAVMCYMRVKPHVHVYMCYMRYTCTCYRH